MREKADTSGGLTLIELLIVITLLTALAALVFPVFASARAMARRALCINNLRQIGLALCLYREDNGEMPPHLSSLYPTYLPDPQVFVCPDDPLAGRREGDDSGYMEGNRCLPSGVSYTYLPNWKYAVALGWWHRRPHYGEGKWQDATPVAMCHWHWAAGRNWRRELDAPTWGAAPRGWVLVLAAGGSVHRARAEVPAPDFTPECYR